MGPPNKKRHPLPGCLFLFGGSHAGIDPQRSEAKRRFTKMPGRHFCTRDRRGARPERTSAEGEGQDGPSAVLVSPLTQRMTAFQLQRGERRKWLCNSYRPVSPSGVLASFGLESNLSRLARRSSGGKRQLKCFRVRSEYENGLSRFGDRVGDPRAPSLGVEGDGPKRCRPDELPIGALLSRLGCPEKRARGLGLLIGDLRPVEERVDALGDLGLAARP